MSKACFAIALALLGAFPAAAQNLSPYTFRITTAGCKTTNGHPKHVLTGFRLSAQVGIVTALHGVVGCAEIYAANSYGLNIGEPLQIAAVDLDRDLALLKSSKLSQLPAGGFGCRCVSTPCAAAPNICSAATSASPGDLRIEGTPRGNLGLGAKVEANYPFLGQLDPILGDKYREKVSNRNSPSLTIQVARISGFEPGDSGGPVLNPASEVIAVADGGLEGGGSKVGWAIPYQDVRWVPVLNLTGTARKRYNDLQDLAIDDLFAYEEAASDGGPAVVIDKESVLRGLRKIMDGTGTTSWESPSYSGSETRKFVSLTGCQLTFEDHEEHERGGTSRIVFQKTVTIDLSDARVQVSARNPRDGGPSYPTGTMVVNLVGTPGFQPVHEVGSSTSENALTNQTFDHEINRTSNNWVLYYTTKAATDAAVSVLNNAIGLCRLGQ